MQELLDRWDGEELHTEEGLVKFANELWVTVAEFEKDLKESMKGHELVLSMKEFRHQSHVDWIKNKFGFYIELYETTINELKLRQQR